MKSKKNRTLPINLLEPPLIKEAFEMAVEQCEKQGHHSAYLSGVADALGWVLGEYEESPLE